MIIKTALRLRSRRPEMKITAIRSQVKNSERVSVFVDGKYSFSLSLDELIAHKLKKDCELSLANINKFKKISADGKLRARALEWLLNRPHSIREFKDYLYRKKADPEITQSLVAEFLERKYLDDAKFGEWLVELQKRRGKSNRAIRAELFKKGLDREMIEELMESEKNNEQERLKALIAKKRQTMRYKNNPQKLAQYLTNQGFSYGMVKEALSINSPEE